MPNADHDQSGQDVIGVAGAGSQPGEQEHGDDPEDHAADDQRLGACPRRTRVCTVVEVTTIVPVIGRNARPVVSGEKCQALLHVVREEQEHAEDAGAGERDRRVGPRRARGERRCAAAGADAASDARSSRT